MILACGDLPRPYLEFLVTMANRPLFYVRGNHDDYLERDPPEGCVCIDGKLIVYQGIRIMGLGGSYRYREGNNVYTEQQMQRRILRLKYQLWKNKGFDILLTHAPARGVNDFDSLSHRGFECFLRLMDQYEPRYLIHGHIHKNYGMHIPQITVCGATTVINAYASCAFEY